MSRVMEWSQSPQGQHDAFTWFTQSQLQSVIRNGLVPEWFHGIISRKTAEELLMSKPPGYFLIRVSESRIGYTLSYCAGDRCRHFMIDVLEDGHYIIVGENRRHRSLQDLVDFHRRTPIMPFCQVLTVACGQSTNDKTDYAELLFPQRHPNASLQPNNSLLPRISYPLTQEEDIPPALPYRRNNQRNSMFLPPNSQPNRLYPCLEDEHTTPPLSAKPVPMTRKRYTADNPPFNQPPEVPSRSCMHLKLNQTFSRTASTLENPSTSTPSEQPHCANTLPVKYQETKPSVVTNLKNFKKKFQKKRSTSQDNTYAEIIVETTDRSDTENEYQEIGEERILSCSSVSCTDMRVTDEVLPQEYLPPPPFAPGY